ncbi:TonB family protein [bacterium]|nr:MAG: TonB family protein [bacterium]
MEERQEIFSLYAAFAASLVLHGAIIALGVGTFTPQKKADSLIFTVSMVDTMSGSDSGSAPLPPVPIPSPPRPAAPVASEKAAAPSMEAQKPAEAGGGGEGGTSPSVEASPPVQVPAAIETPHSKSDAATVIIPLPAQGKGTASGNGAPSPAAKSEKSVKLREFKPSKEDFITLAPMSTAPPDPVKEKGEVTLSLGDPDLRYRGYLDRVRSSVDRSWNWREAILAAGRPGSVTVRVTITRSGQADAVLVTSSGSKILDNETIATVRRAQLPDFPEEWAITKLNLIAEFQYTYGD